MGPGRKHIYYLGQLAESKAACTEVFAPESGCLTVLLDHRDTPAAILGRKPPLTG